MFITTHFSASMNPFVGLREYWTMLENLLLSRKSPISEKMKKFSVQQLTSEFVFLNWEVYETSFVDEMH